MEKQKKDEPMDPAFVTPKKTVRDKVSGTAGKVSSSIRKLLASLSPSKKPGEQGDAAEANIAQFSPDTPESRAQLKQVFAPQKDKLETGEALAEGDVPAHIVQSFEESQVEAVPKVVKAVRAFKEAHRGKFTVHEDVIDQTINRRLIKRLAELDPNNTREKLGVADLTIPGAPLGAKFRRPKMGLTPALREYAKRGGFRKPFSLAQQTAPQTGIAPARLIGRGYVSDDSDTDPEIEEPVHAPVPVKRKRGRPLGSKTKRRK